MSGRVYLVALAVSCAWLVFAAAATWWNGWTVGRYANSLSGEYVAHCWKTFDVEFGREKVAACIERQLPSEENDEVWRRTVRSYAGQAWRLFAFLSSVPLLTFGILAAWSLLQGFRTNSSAPTIP